MVPGWWQIVAVIAVLGVIGLVIIAALGGGPGNSPAPTDATQPALVPAPPSTPSRTPSPTRTRVPTPSPTPQPAWIADFAEPILAAIADRPPDFEDDFSVQNRGWVWYAPQQPGLEVRTLVAEDEVARIQGGFIQHSRVDNLTARDFVLEVDARVPEYEGDGNVEVWFHFDHPSQNYIVSANLGRRDWSVQSIRPTSPSRQVHDSASGSASLSPLGESTRITIVVRSPGWAVYFNGAPTAYLVDPNLATPMGNVHFDCGSPECEFDNVKVWNLDNVPDLP